MKVVIDVSACQPIHIDDRFVLERQCLELFSTMALVSETILGTVIASSLIQKRSRHMDIKYFDDKHSAIQWLKNCNSEILSLG